jgi:hypothetical protein
MDALNVTYPTSRSDMRALISMKIVRELPNSKNPKRFIASDIFRLAYFDD